MKLNHWAYRILPVAAFLILSACADDDAKEADTDWNLSENNDAPQPEPQPEPEPEPTPIAASQPIGNACASDAECLSGLCLTDDRFPGGYCSSRDCDACDSNSFCATDTVERAICARGCSWDDECRPGYACAEQGLNGEKVCVPPRGVADGEACTGNDDCQNGRCMGWEGGHCTTTRCTSRTDCSRQGFQNECLQVGGGRSFCVRTCEDNAGCRDGYVCEDIGGGNTICTPDPTPDPLPLDDQVFMNNPLNITCGIPVENQRASFEFEVNPTTTAYMVTPISRDGKPFLPTHIERPSGDVLDFSGPAAFHTLGASFHVSMNPTMVPSTETYLSALEAGTNTYHLEASGEEMCYYKLEEDTPGDSIDLNVYLVGVPDTDAATAATNSNLQAVLAEFGVIYAQAGISVGKTRYFELGAEDTARFEVIRSADEVQELVKRSVAPGNDLDSVLSVNIFFTGAFAMQGAIGISSGLPGPAGLHGTHGSGVVFTSENMGRTIEDGYGVSVDGNLYTGLILAHEVGHYLGLFHTTQFDQRGRVVGYDPLGDTPQCTNLADCPDTNNLMFPFAGDSHTELTTNQNYMIGANPLTKTATTTDGGTP